MRFAPAIDGHTVVYLKSVDTHMGTRWWCGTSGAVLRR